jgi:hypothetical protein
LIILNYLRKTVKLLCTTFFVLLVAMPRGVRAEEEPVTPSNLRMFQSIAGRLADSLGITQATGDTLSVVLTIYPQDVRWFLREPAEQALRKRGWTVTSAPAERFAAEISFLEMKVKYANPRRSGIFGPKLVDRRVTVQAQMRLTDTRESRMLVDGERTLEASDIVEMSLIESLENPSVPQTHGAYPSEDFFGGWAEPLVLLGAVAIAVYLLFTVRS